MLMMHLLQHGPTGAEDLLLIMQLRSRFCRDVWFKVLDDQRHIGTMAYVH